MNARDEPKKPAATISREGANLKKGKMRITGRGKKDGPWEIRKQKPNGMR